jgi:hypothetical protein
VGYMEKSYLNKALLWINMAENQNCPTTFAKSFPYQFSSKSETLYGMHGKVHLWFYINHALLCINMAENQNFPTFGGSLPY